jgi:serine protease Do
MQLLLLSALLGGGSIYSLDVARADGPLPPVISPTSAPPRAAPPSPWHNPRETPVVLAVQRVRDAVVNIHSERTVSSVNAVDELTSHTPSQNRVNGMGSGIVIDQRGWIVTNQHVVDEVNSLRVRLSDGTVLPARIVERDNEHDLALIKITPPHPLAVMPLGTGRDLQVGETVIAIGNAYGYDHTVTVGVVSALNRDVTLNKDMRYKSLIQTDASINPGNSGGPLVNIQGELIGVNVAIRAGAQGIGFAIPVDNMIRVTAALLARARHAQGVAPLGLGLTDEPLLHEPPLNVSSTAPQGTGSARRITVNTVDTDSSAAKAGVKTGDVLVRVGDMPVHSSLDVQRALLEVKPGQRVTMVIQRDGTDRTLTLDLPDLLGEWAWRKVGASLRPVEGDQVTRANPQLHGGLLVVEVRPEAAGQPSPAARAGLKAGDVLVGLHSWEMLTLENVRFVFQHPERTTFAPRTGAAPGGACALYYLRENQIQRGTLALPE